MKFAAMIEYVQDKDKVEALRPTHRQYLRGLIDAGKLAITGPLTDGWGALIVYEANSPEEAEALLKADPFHDGGVFVRWTIRPWNPVMANPKLLPS
jgi:uncharacterized protein